MLLLVVDCDWIVYGVVCGSVSIGCWMGMFDCYVVLFVCSGNFCSGWIVGLCMLLSCCMVCCWWCCCWWIDLCCVCWVFLFIWMYWCRCLGIMYLFCLDCSWWVGWSCWWVWVVGCGVYSWVLVIGWLLCVGMLFWCLLFSIMLVVSVWFWVCWVWCNWVCVFSRCCECICVSWGFVVWSFWWWLDLFCCVWMFLLLFWLFCVDVVFWGLVWMIIWYGIVCVIVCWLCFGIVWNVLVVGWWNFLVMFVFCVVWVVSWMFWWRVCLWFVYWLFWFFFIICEGCVFVMVMLVWVDCLVIWCGFLCWNFNVCCVVCCLVWVGFGGVGVGCGRRILCVVFFFWSVWLFCCVLVRSVWCLLLCWVVCWWWMFVVMFVLFVICLFLFVLVVWC